MSQQNLKFNAIIIEYCSHQAERAYTLFEDNDTNAGLEFLGHLADVLQMLVESKNTHGVISIDDFTRSVSKLNDLEKDQIYTHLQENGFGQYIPE